MRRIALIRLLSWILNLTRQLELNELKSELERLGGSYHANNTDKGNAGNRVQK